ncbi:MAG: LapA family protein [Micrococcales bacterium]|nr:LapA family protein [Micrococcales bacterium]
MANQDKTPDATPKPTERQDHVYGTPPGAGDWRRITRLVLLAVLVVYTVLFFLMNRTSVDVSLVVTTVNIPLIWTLIGTFLLGAVVMYLLMYLRRRAERKART